MKDWNLERDTCCCRSLLADWRGLPPPEATTGCFSWPSPPDAQHTPGEGDRDWANTGAEFSRLYIDMMILHHQSIVALAQVAHDHRIDARLKPIATGALSKHGFEIAQLGLYREQFYGKVHPKMVDASIEEIVTEEIPDVADAPSITLKMDRQRLVSVFCSSARARIETSPSSA